jgi:hypothetical protein
VGFLKIKPFHLLKIIFSNMAPPSSLSMTSILACCLHLDHGLHFVGFLSIFMFRFFSISSSLILTRVHAIVPSLIYFCIV